MQVYGCMPGRHMQTFTNEETSSKQIRELPTVSLLALSPILWQTLKTPGHQHRNEL
jgi:hypothetical protein